jgi:hypothetical protein
MMTNQVPHLRLESLFAEVVLDKRRRGVEGVQPAMQDILEEVGCAFLCLIARPNFGCRAQTGGGLPDTCMVPRTYKMHGQVQVLVSGATAPVEIKSGMDKLLKRNVTVQVMLAVPDLAAASSVLEITKNSKIKELMRQQLLELGVARCLNPKP